MKLSAASDWPLPASGYLGEYKVCKLIMTRALVPKFLPCREKISMEMRSVLHNTLLGVGPFTPQVCGVNISVKRNFQDRSNGSALTSSFLFPFLLFTPFCGHVLLVPSSVRLTLYLPPSFLWTDYNYVDIIIGIILFPHYKPICFALLCNPINTTKTRRHTHTRGFLSRSPALSPYSLITAAT